MFHKGNRNSIVYVFLALIMVFLSSCEDSTDPVSPDDHEHELNARVLVSDPDNFDIHVVDLINDSVTKVKTLTTNSSLYASNDKRFAVVIATDADEVFLFDSGLYVEDHGDHAHEYAKKPELLSVPLGGLNPVHVGVEAGWMTIFNDKSGTVSLVNESELAVAPDSYSPGILDVGIQHGAAVPLYGDIFAVTTANPSYVSTGVGNPLPIGAHIRDQNNNILYSDADSLCPNLHGEASNGNVACFGCGDGVLILSTNGDYTHFHIPNPSEMPEGFRIGSVWGNENMPFFYGRAVDSGESAGIWKISPQDSLLTQVIPANGPRDIALSLSKDGDEMAVLFEDGSISIYDTESGQVMVTAGSIIKPVNDHSDHGKYHPDIQLSFGYLFVSDPGNSQVKIFNSEDLIAVKSVSVPGKPTKLAAMGYATDDHTHNH